MTGFSGSNGSTTNNPSVSEASSGQVIDSVAVSIIQGATAQSWAGVASAENNSALGNSSLVHTPGFPNPEDKTAGNLAVGQPGGNPSDVIIQSVDAANAGTTPGSNLVDAFVPAGTAGGGGSYPNGFQSPATSAVPNPQLAFGWTAQNPALNEDDPLSVAVNPEYTAPHGTAATIVTPAISGGSGTYTVVTVDSSTNGSDNGAHLPTGFTLTASTGAVAINGTTSAAGTYTLVFRVNDSASPAKYAAYEVTVVLS